MLKVNTRIIVPACTFAMAVVFLVMGFTKYGFWHQTKGPMSGFFPIIMSILMILVSSYEFVNALKDTNPPVYHRSEWFLVLMSVVLYISIMLLGMYVTMTAFLFLWLKVYEKCAWKITLIVTGVVMGIVVATFTVWLKVQFPIGTLFELILG